MQTRRRFLKSTGAVMAGGLVAGTAGASATNTCSDAELPSDFIYLNSGTEGSMPDCVLSAFQDGLQKWASNPTTSYESDPLYEKLQVLNRERIASFLNVGKNNICLTDNTTMGLSMTLMGLNFSRNDKVITTDHEHMAIRSPLRVLKERVGIEIKTRSFPSTSALRNMTATELMDTLFPDDSELRGAKALCVSHVYPTTGVRLPLRALRHKADQLNIRYLIVDGAQAFGMLDLTTPEEDIRHCDFYACPGHKWLNGPPSTGVLYIKNENIQPPEFYPTISQCMGNYTSYDSADDVPIPMAEALQVRGNSNTPGFAAMVEAIDFAKSAGGTLTIENHILRLSSKFKESILAKAPNSIVSPHTDSALSSGLTVFFPFRWDSPQTTFSDKKTADWVVAELLKQNIQIRSIGFLDPVLNTAERVEVRALRVSTAHFNTDRHLELLAEALRDVLMQIG